MNEWILEPLKKCHVKVANNTRIWCFIKRIQHIFTHTHTYTHVFGVSCRRRVWCSVLCLSMCLCLYDIMCCLMKGSGKRKRGPMEAPLAFSHYWLMKNARLCICVYVCHIFSLFTRCEQNSLIFMGLILRWFVLLFFFVSN